MKKENFKQVIELMEGSLVLLATRNSELIKELTKEQKEKMELQYELQRLTIENSNLKKERTQIINH